MMTLRDQRDHEEFEPVTKDTWTARMTELAEDSPEVNSEQIAVVLGAWLEPHVEAGHGGTGLRWTRAQNSRYWEVHAQCGQCRRNSAAHQTGPDPSVPTDLPESHR